MDPRERVLLPIYSTDAAGRDVYDVPSLFLHLLLFDTVILKSPRLEDVAAIVRAIGVTDTLRLLNSGCLLIRMRAEAIGGILEEEQPIVRVGHLHTTMDERTELRTTARQTFAPLNMRNTERRELREAIAVRRAPGPDIVTAAIADGMREATRNLDVFNAALGVAIRRWDPELSVPTDAVRLELVDDDAVRFEAPKLDVPQERIAQVVLRACLAVIGLNAEFARIREQCAVTALDEVSAALVEWKLAYLHRIDDPSRRTETFTRVLDAVGLPSFDDAVRTREIDVRRFLAIRQTRECREFRSFLNQASSMPADELKERAENLRKLFGETVRSGPGKLARFIATTGLGALTGGAAAAGIGAADSFVMEKLFPTDGIVTFVGKQYPTIFG